VFNINAVIKIQIIVSVVNPQNELFLLLLYTWQLQVNVF
jgi:hypothetical protein